ncbi:Uncharacterised protein [Anaerotruncus sp. 2789STDY5834896]|uniref:Uncharacterized protein n=1 Tax=uncultured Anaerotruncus sp. TaxID=905011 RepID=A0A1C6GKV8_9FIRM|nr:Uncharacterised protein [uncultured Anaerotruncus sp.]
MRAEKRMLTWFILSILVLGMLYWLSFALAPTGARAAEIPAADQRPTAGCSSYQRGS